MREIKEIKGEEFRRMQLLQLDMLKEFDRVCRTHGIKYSIDAGTLLGAVRHKGYIPWDDDADLAMTREEYQKFKEVADEMDPKVCYFQDHETDPEYRWGYGKLRRTGTTFVRVGQEHIKCKTGVFVDVFPFDDVPKSVLGQMLQDFYCFCLRKILWSEVARVSDPNWFWRCWFGVLSCVPSSFVFNRIKRFVRKSANATANRIRVLLFVTNGKLNKKKKPPLRERYGMPKEWLLDVVDYEFEGVKLLGSRDYVARLTYQYGSDYMQLPPLEKRLPHAPVSSYTF